MDIRSDVGSDVELNLGLDLGSGFPDKEIVGKVISEVGLPEILAHLAGTVCPRNFDNCNLGEPNALSKG